MCRNILLELRISMLDSSRFGADGVSACCSLSNISRLSPRTPQSRVFQLHFPQHTSTLNLAAPAIRGHRRFSPPRAQPQLLHPCSNVACLSHCRAVEPSHQDVAVAPLQAGASDAMLLWFIVLGRTQSSISTPKQVSAVHSSNTEA